MVCRCGTTVGGTWGGHRTGAPAEPPARPALPIRRPVGVPSPCSAIQVRVGGRVKAPDPAHADRLRVDGPVILGYNSRRRRGGGSSWSGPGAPRAGRGTRTQEIVMQDFREVGAQSQELGSVGRRRRAGHGQPDHARVRRRRRASSCKRGPIFDLGIPFDGNGPQPGGGRINPVRLMSETGAAAGRSRARSTTPTTTCSCRCRRRRSGTGWPTCSTTTSCTTGSRRATSGRTARCTARSTRWPRASPAVACCSTSPA